MMETDRHGLVWFAVAVIGLALAVTVADSRDVTAPSAKMESTGASIRALGFPCERVHFIERVRMLPFAATPEIYLVRCGLDGPDYRVTVTPDRRQTITRSPS